MTSIILPSLIIGLFFAFVIWWTYSYEKERLGSATAKKLLPQQLFLEGISLGLIILAQDLNTIVGISFVTLGVIWFGVETIRLLLVHSPAGVLVDAGEANKSYPGIMIYGSLSFIFIVLSLVFSKANFLVVGTLFLILMIYAAVYKEKARHLVTETGLFQGFSEVRWEQIKNYWWAKNTGEKVVLVFQTSSWRPSFLSYHEMTIPIKYKHRVDYFLSKQVNALPAQVSG